jgi:hypothetical protein
MTLSQGYIAFSQQGRYIVKRSSISSRLTDEFSPVFYKDGIIFCSNINDKSFVSYKSDQGRLFKIYFASIMGAAGWKQPELFSKELTSGFNDGPATFNHSGDIIFFNRNNRVDGRSKNVADTSNKLGIYSSVLRNGVWTDVTPFQFNNADFTLGTPSLSPDGKRLYFASDIPGGFGRMDLYYCDSTDAGWSKPVNLGPSVNTPENESFPFADKNGKIFFASEGHDGIGGKDIFYTYEIDGEWLDPVHFDAPINSERDDFGIVTDSTFSGGFFSSNRMGTDDIFSFTELPPEFGTCDSVKENRYCFTLYDENNFTDTIPVKYLWDMGDGNVKYGKEVYHCFPGQGKFLVKLCIIDELTGDTISSDVNYNVEIENINQGYIKSDTIGNPDREMTFNGVISDFKDFRVSGFYWDFGEGFAPGGPVMEHIFHKRGEYEIKMGLLGEKGSDGISPAACFMRKILILK